MVRLKVHGIGSEKEAFENFNSKMVRLKVYQQKQTTNLNLDFNSKMVRLKAVESTTKKALFKGFSVNKTTVFFLKKLSMSNSIILLGFRQLCKILIISVLF